MPQSIKPVHSLSSHSELFDIPRSGISDLQSRFLDEKPAVTAEKAKVSEATLDHLERIVESKDEVISAATAFASHQPTEETYRVPSAIGDYDLLGLKTSGYVKGSGRAVTLTDMGRIALRNRWLGESNVLREKRVKKKFDIRSAESAGETRIAATDDESMREGSTLWTDESEDGDDWGRDSILKAIERLKERNSKPDPWADDPIMDAEEPSDPSIEETPRRKKLIF